MVAELDPVFVELYLRCKQNPYLAIPGGKDAARVFVIDMERQLEKLNNLSLSVLVMSAQGHFGGRIASELHISKRSVCRRLREIYLMPQSWEAADSG